MSDSTKKNVQPKIIVNPNMRDYGKEPFFVNKLKEAREFLEKHPLPKEFTAKKK